MRGQRISGRGGRDGTEAAFGPDHPRVRGIRANLARLSGPTGQATATGDGDTWPSST